MDRRSFLRFGNNNVTVDHGPLSISGGLEPYVPSVDKPWNARRAAHLLRRTGSAAPWNQVETVLASDPQSVVDSIVNEALGDPLPDPPLWHDTYPPPRGSSNDERTAFRNENRLWFAEYRTDWMLRIMSGRLRENLAFFWANHFVTESASYTLATYAVQYLTMMRTHALGNFKQFVHDIGLTPSMLLYLNGHQNHKNNPNENYARELLELFTTGIGHYSEADIQEISRALTGWRVDYYTLSVGFVESRHDLGTKEIFGRTGTWNYNDVINLVFEERAEETARYICRKLYQHFVYEIPDEGIVQQLAQIFLANDFELAPVVKTILSSEHFFEDDFFGAQIKSPARAMLGFMTEIGHTVPADQLYRRVYRYMLELGQILFSPPDVSGWPGHHFWISTTTLALRWYYAQFLLNGTSGLNAYDPVPYASAIAQNEDPYELAYELAYRILAVELPEDEKQNLGDILLDGIPYYEWDVNAPGSDQRLKNYLLYLCRLPEFQLT